MEAKLPLHAMMACLHIRSTGSKGLLNFYGQCSAISCSKGPLHCCCSFTFSTSCRIHCGQDRRNAVAFPDYFVNHAVDVAVVSVVIGCIWKEKSQISSRPLGALQRCRMPFFHYFSETNGGAGNHITKCNKVIRLCMTQHT